MAGMLSIRVSKNERGYRLVPSTGRALDTINASQACERRGVVLLLLRRVSVNFEWFHDTYARNAHPLPQLGTT